MNERELLAERARLLDEAKAIHDKAEAENRDLTPEEAKIFDEKKLAVETLNKRIERARVFAGGTPEKPERAPAVVKTRGDNFANALGAWVRDGDTGGVQTMMRGKELEIRASNNTDMNIGTAADGGYAVPTGFYNQIIARRDEISLPSRLGVRRIPGIGTTVNVPLDAEDDGEFVSTNEAAAFDRDAPAIGQKALTLVKYSKYIELSYELLQDEDARLMDFLTDFVARGQAKTLNNLLLTEVAANGTNLKTFASTTALAIGELESIVYNDNLAAYLDDTASCSWVTRPSTFGAISALTGNPRVYAETPAGSRERPGLLGFPVAFSQKVAAPAANAKTVYFGNWNFVGWREDPGFTLLRDPYSKASSGQVVLWMYFRTVFGVLQAEAIGYGTQAAV